MKKFKIITLVAIALLTISNVNATNSSKDKKVIGVFENINVDYEYVFKLDDGKTITFNEIDYDSGLELSEENFDEKYEVTYIEIEEEMYDEDGNETGETYSIKRIVGLKLQ